MAGSPGCRDFRGQRPAWAPVHVRPGAAIGQRGGAGPALDLGLSRLLHGVLVLTDKGVGQMLRARQYPFVFLRDQGKVGRALEEKSWRKLGCTLWLRVQSSPNSVSGLKPPFQASLGRDLAAFVCLHTSRDGDLTPHGGRS